MKNFFISLLFTNYNSFTRQGHCHRYWGHHLTNRRLLRKAINRFMLSVLGRPKVISLSGAYCSWSQLVLILRNKFKLECYFVKPPVEGRLAVPPMANSSVLFVICGNLSCSRGLFFIYFSYYKWFWAQKRT